MLNEVTLIGNLGQDPEMRITNSGTPVTQLRLATSRKWTTKDGEKKEETEWHRVVAWAKQAQLCNDFLRKGSKIFVRGRLATRSWSDKDGNQRYITEVIAEFVRFLDKRSEKVGHEPPAASPGLADDIPEDNIFF
ncbi:MAG: single-stranded DNA-binding protein [Rhodobacter sp.]|nr:single-stranded DNA-binding protein [Rhodobacter sp.]